MAYETRYSVNERVIHNRLYGEMTPEDPAGFNTATLDLIRSGDAPVHLIFDTSDLQPVGVPLKDVLEMVTFPGENKLGWVIIVGENPFARFVGSLLMQAGRVKYRMVGSLDEAVAILQRMDTSLQYVMQEPQS
ncbi:MAG TPA: hypothetical protein VHD90_04605 [Phototrophicaceae bacterium]|nr:hypothetical protein [Phototrophicaceae bacterium]